MSPQRMSRRAFFSRSHCLRFRWAVHRPESRPATSRHAHNRRPSPQQQFRRGLAAGRTEQRQRLLARQFLQSPGRLVDLLAVLRAAPGELAPLVGASGRLDPKRRERAGNIAAPVGMIPGVGGELVAFRRPCLPPRRPVAAQAAVAVSWCARWRRRTSPAPAGAPARRPPSGAISMCPVSKVRYTGLSHAGASARATPAASASIAAASASAMRIATSARRVIQCPDTMRRPSDCHLPHHCPLGYRSASASWPIASSPAASWRRPAPRCNPGRRAPDRSRPRQRLQVDLAHRIGDPIADEDEASVAGRPERVGSGTGRDPLGTLGAAPLTSNTSTVSPPVMPTSRDLPSGVPNTSAGSGPVLIRHFSDCVARSTATAHRCPAR